MASSRKRSRICWSYDVPFSNLDDKHAFQARFDAIRRLLDPAGRLDRHGVLCAMMDMVESTASRLPELQADRPPGIHSFLTNSGETACEGVFFFLE